MQPGELPLRYAYVERPADYFDFKLRVFQICADDGSVWARLDELLSLAQQLYTELGISTSQREVAAPQLTAEEARSFTLTTSSPPDQHAIHGSVPVELARLGCHVDYLARRYGVRCGLKQMGERRKRYVHTVGGCLLQPTSCLLALSEVAGGNSNQLDSIAASMLCNSE